MIQGCISTMLACLQLCTMVIPQPTLGLSHEKPRLSFCLSSRDGIKAQDNGGRRPQHLHSLRTPRACCQSSYLLWIATLKLKLVQVKAIHLQIYLQLKKG